MSILLFEKVFNLVLVGTDIIKKLPWLFFVSLSEASKSSYRTIEIMLIKLINISIMEMQTTPKLSGNM